MALLQMPMIKPRRTMDVQYGDDDNANASALLDAVREATAASGNNSPPPIRAEQDDAPDVSPPRALAQPSPSPSPTPDVTSASRQNPMEIPTAAQLKLPAGMSPNFAINDDFAGHTSAGVPPRSLATPTPDMSLPDYDSLPGAKRVHDLQSQVDARMNPKPVDFKHRLLKLVPSAIALGLGGAMGGMEGVGAAAGGVNEYNHDQRMFDQQGLTNLTGQLTEAEKEQEKQYETGARAKEYGANLESNRLYRQTLLGDRKANNDSKNNINLLKLGLGPDGKPLDESELPPQMRSKIMLDRLHGDLTQAQQDLVEAKTKGIPEQIQIAQQKVDLANKAYQLRASGQGLSERKFAWQQYKDTNPDLPTAATKTKIQQASAVKGVGDHLVENIKANSDLLGPVMGRWTNFETFLGDQSPEAAALKSEMMSYAALHPALHQFRGNQALQHFWDAMGGMKSNPDALVAGVKSLTDSAGRMSDAWRGGTSGGGRGITAPPPPKDVPIGTKKKFPNGKTGVWDGHGYVQQ